MNQDSINNLELNKIKSFQDLVVWQKAHLLVLDVYELSQRIPEEEKFGLTSQIRRASVSIPTNIAEGMGRNSPKDFVRFLYIARGSAEETKYLVILLRDLQMLSENESDDLLKRISTVGRMLNGLISSLASKL